MARAAAVLLVAGWLIPVAAGAGQAITGTVDANAASNAGSIKLVGAAVPVTDPIASHSSGGLDSHSTPGVNVPGVLVTGASSTSADGNQLADIASASATTSGLNVANLITASATAASCTTPSNGAAPTATSSASGLGLGSALAGLGLSAPGLPASTTTTYSQTPIKLLGASVGYVEVNKQTSTTSGALRSVAVTAFNLHINALGVAVVDLTSSVVDCTTTAVTSAPTVTSVTPSQGPQVGGQTVTIDGTNFLGISSVVIGGISATFTRVSQTRVTAVTPAHAPATVNVVVTNPFATSATAAANQYVYLPTPTLTAISPATGPESGGTTVVLTGTGFTGATAVDFGGTAASGYTVVGATQITATAPAGSGTQFVTVTAPGGTTATSAAGAYTYVVLPTLTSISPTSGPATGGTTVTLTGTGFTAASQVRLAGALQAVTYVSPTSLQITTPAHAAGAVTLDVTTIGGTTGTQNFTYLAVPTATGLISPDYGSTVGGTSVTVAGTGLTSVTGVTVDGVAATVTGQTATTLTFTTPVHAVPGAVAVVLTGPSSITTSAGSYTYVLPGQPGPHDPTVTSLTRATGSVAGGTSVAIAGTNFTGATAVTFGGVAATSFTVNSAVSITATAPAAASSGSVSVLVTTPVATSAVSVGGTFVYQPLTPVLTSISPTHGPDTGGTTVTLTGANFTVASTVLMNSATTVPSTYVDPAHLTVTMPPHAAGAVDLLVQTTALLQSVNRVYTYDPTPTVATLTPASGTAAGGTTVTVTGTNLTTVTHVDVDGTDVVPATSTSTNLTFLTPAHAAGSVSVILRDAATAGAASFSVTAGSYLFVTPAPTITGVSPTHGPLAGGTTVTITGTNLSGVGAVTIGGAAATVTGTPTATSITVTAPAAGTAGAATLLVTTPGGTASSSYTYDPLPTVTGLSPVQGPDTGGTAVTITGTGFTGATAVRFGATSGTSLSVLSSTQLTVSSPAHLAGQVDVTVVTPSGTSPVTAADHYTFIDTTVAPAVTGINPNLGSTVGGTTVTVTGSGFLTATGVKFGTTAGTGLAIVSDTSLTIVSPAHAAGIVNLTVTNPNGTSPTVLADFFTFVSPLTPPVVTSLSPTVGPIAGGTAVTVSGVGFTGATAVKFGAASGTSLTVVSDTQLTVVSPAHAAGQVDLTVTGPGGTSTATLLDRFTYVTAPIVSTIAPAHGPEAGGTSVTLTGSGFTGATGVSFGAAPGTALTVSSDTSLTVSSPAGTGSVQVTVTGPGGTSAGQTYAFDPPPVVTSVLPGSGTTLGGATVVIAGTGFSGATSVSFGAAAGAITLVTPVAVTVTTPSHAAGVVDVTVTTPYGTSATSSADHYTFVPPAPSISSLSPASGPAAGGTTVTVTGTGFTDVTGVSFGGTAGTAVAVASDTSLTVSSPAHASGAVSLTLTGPGGTSNGFTYTYNPLPAVTGLVPSSGPAAGGTLVAIAGSGFTGTTAVQFGASSASFTVVTDNLITVTAPAQPAGTVDVTVLGPNGASPVVTADRFTYTPPPAPFTTGLSPPAGPTAGGTTVTVTGTGFTGATGVTFGGVAGTAVSVSSDTSLTVSSPVHAAGGVQVVVTGPGGSSSGSTFTYVAPPVVTSVLPASGTTAGGTVVVISGSGFSGASAVKFGATNGTALLVTPTAITVTTPAHSAGVVDVTVTTPYGTSAIAAADQYTYVTPAPSISSLSPTSGPETGGTLVTITGSGFTGATGVSFGAVAGAGVVVSSDTSLTVSSPAGTGAVLVTVTGPGGTSGGSLFTYDPPPAVVSVLPGTGTTVGGDSVVVAGTGFGGATSVSFGGVLGGITSVTPVAITVITPAHAAGVVDVQVTTPNGISAITAADQYTYVPPMPAITSLTPASGPVPGGTTVTLTGSGFTGATGVSFGGVAGTNVVVGSDTSLTVSSPAGSGAVLVTVTGPGGTSNGSVYTYDAPPAVLSVTPASGPTAGGTTVSIAGTGFVSGATTVSFGASLAATVSVITPVLMLVTTPAHAAGLVDVRVTTPNGTSVVTVNDQFTFVPPAPSISSLSPTAGPEAGGTLVTITGSGFTGATAVDFGASPGTSVTVSSNTSLTVLSPPGTGLVQVTVVGPGGTSLGSLFTYDPPPAVVSLVPNQGTTLGGDTVVIAGTGLTGATAVDFGGVAGTITLVTPVAVTVSTPAHAAGTVDVTLTTPNGTSAVTVNDQFTFVPPAPLIVSLSPADGPEAGGTLVTITGAGFTGATAVNFGATPGTSVTVSSNTSMTVLSPPGTGLVQVTVVGPGGTSLGSPFTYDPPPAVLSLVPNQGTTLGGDAVVIAGTGLTGASAVTFGGVAGTITLVTPVAVTVTTPAHAAGVVDVRVTTPNGTSAVTVNDQFTFVPPAPLILTLSPANGPEAGSTLVTITGTGFTGATAVNFGAMPGTSVTVSSNTSMTVLSPPGTGVVTVTVVGPGGASVGSPFTYDPPPAVVSLVPNQGTTLGGDTVVIAGTGLTGATAVDFGGVAGTITLVTPVAVTVTTPAHAAGVVDVRVTTPNGTSAVTVNDQFTFVPPAPLIGSLSPADGPEAGGTLVTIAGAGFTGATAVNFGAMPGTSVTVSSNTSMTVLSPPGTGVVTVTVVGPGGASVGSPFTYDPPPGIVSLVPNQGTTLGGDTVVIAGTGLTGATAVDFGGVAGTITLVTPVAVTVTTPAHAAGAVDVTITTPNGTSAVTVNGQFTFVPPAPLILTLSPVNGPEAGGTLVTITGTGFTGATAVNFGATPGSSVTVSSDTSMTVLSPPGTGLVQVTVVGPVGTSLGSPFTYDPPPAVLSLVPNQGTTAGGDTVVIAGTGLTGATAVDFGGVAGTITLVTPVAVTVTTPAHAAGAVDVTITTPNGTSAVTVNDQFTFVPPAPLIVSLSPADGPEAGGTLVTITGSGFTGATAVNFGATPGTSVTVSSDTSMTVLSPPGTGLVQVTVVGPGGTSLGSLFTYDPPPAVVSLVPNQGTTLGGDTVVIAGTGLTGATAVDFGGVAGTITLVTPVAVTVSTPAHAAGTVDVTITTPNGTSAVTVNDQFTFVPPAPLIGSLSPADGPEAGGTLVTITGTGFTGATAVNFGATPGTSVTVSSNTSLTVLSPPGTGLVQVTVVGPGGTSLGSPFTYDPPPGIVSLVPNQGTTAGGDTVVIAGTGLTGATAVDFGGVAGAITLVTPVAVTVSTPAHAAGTVDVTLTSPNGTSAVTVNDQFTFVPPAPLIGSLSPADGPEAGGTLVTITGTGFTGATAVNFGAMPGTSVTVSSNTSMTVLSPPGTGLVQVTVVGPGGTSLGSLFTYDPPPGIVSLVPNQGTTLGGDTVVIAGTGLTGATAVDFGGVAGTITLVTPVAVTVSTPAHAAGTVDVTITTPNGTSAVTVNGQFTFVPPAPLILTLSPVNGPEAGGTLVTITGTGFTGATAVNFGATPGTSVTVSSNTSMTVLSPPGTGTVQVTVVGPGGASLGSLFTYDPPPGIVSLVPNQGTTLGGDTVVIAGTGLTGATAVDFGGVAGAITLVTPVAVTVTTPAHAAGVVDVRVTTPNGTSAVTVNDQFTFVPPAPLILTLSPVNGPGAGGTLVTITGSGFTGATAVTFGATPGTSVTVSSDTSMTVLSPPGTGLVQVTVVGPGGTSLGSLFTYDPPPAVVSLVPNQGTTLGGDTVVIAGTGLTGATAVDFGGVAGTITLVTPVAVTVSTPAHAAGTVDVTITTPNGTSAVTVNDQFTFVPPAPLIGSLSPADGPEAGGTLVTITGTGFTGATAVNFGATPGTSVTVSSNTSLTVLSPPGTGLVQVTVVGPGGTSLGSPFTYDPPPGIVSLVPNQGTTAGGDTVVIAGTGLTGATAVDFGGVAGAITLVTPVAVTVSTPAHAAGTVDVTITTPNGTSAVTVNDQFTFVPPAPLIVSLSPANGPEAGGTLVTITGAGFTGATAVNFGATPGTSVTVSSNTSMTVLSPPGTGLVQVTVVGPGGTSLGSPFTYDPPPGIVSLAPNQGTTAGGDTVVISGTGFTGATAVDFGGAAGTITSVTPVAVTVTTPAHAAGTVDVTITTPNGTSVVTVDDQFTFVPPAPAIGSLTPANGPEAGNTMVTITGTGFTGATAVAFGASPGTSVTVSSDTSLTVLSPPGTGTVQVTVVGPGGTSGGSPFTYDPPPSIGSLAPNQGTTAGGDTVVITGTGFTGATAVDFGGTPAVITLVTPTAITVTTPAHAAGIVDVTVTNVNGTSLWTSNDRFTYIPPAPAIGSLAPAHGPEGGATLVTITGTGLTGATAVSFGATPGVNVTVSSDTSLTVASPPGTGTVPVTVTTAGGTSPGSSFTYDPPPSIGSLTPGAGPTAGGTTVTVTGTGFVAGATSVTFGGAPAGSVTVLSPTQLTATTPAHAAGSVAVEATTPAGTSAAGAQFAFLAPVPVIAGLVPAHGPEAGGTPVTITGSGFTGTTAVSFGGTPGTNVSVASDTGLTVTSPPGTGTVAVTVTSAGGTSAAGPFGYDPAPAIGSVTPAAGGTAGGDTVTVLGTGFTDAGAVTFGGIAGVITLVTPTAITVTTPAHAAGPVDVVVTTPAGSSALAPAARFTFVAPAPVVTGLSPASGPIAGGTLVTISGSGFTGATQVMFGSVVVTPVVVDDSTITVTVPAGMAGGVAVSVTTAGGTSAAGPQFTYVAPVPVLSAISPAAGTVTGGTVVTLSGSGFTGATTVTIGGVVVGSFVVHNDSTITFTTPAHLPGDAVVTVTTPGGTSAGGIVFSYLSDATAPVVTAIAPARGPAAGGTRVRVTGAGFIGATTVLFGSVAGTDLQVLDDGTIVVTSPPSGTNGGSVVVTVAGPAGTSSGGPLFEYVLLTERPTIGSITPDVGPVAGGTRLTVTGTNFDQQATVTFDGVPGTNVVIGPDTTGRSLAPAARADGFRAAYSTSLTVDSPAHAPGPVEVLVTNAAGPARAAKEFTFIPRLSGSSVAITLPVRASRTLTVSGADYVELAVTACSAPTGTGSVRLATGGTGCTYTAGTAAGSDRFEMSLVDVLGQTATRTVTVTVTDEGGTGTGGTGGNENPGGDGDGGGTGTGGTGGNENPDGGGSGGDGAGTGTGTGGLAFTGPPTWAVGALVAGLSMLLLGLGLISGDGLGHRSGRRRRSKGSAAGVLPGVDVPPLDTARHG